MSNANPTAEKPAKSWSRDRLVQWLEDNGDQTARKAFLDNVFDRKTKKLDKTQMFELCTQSYARTAA